MLNCLTSAMVIIYFMSCIWINFVVVFHKQLVSGSSLKLCDRTGKTRKGCKSGINVIVLLSSSGKYVCPQTNNSACIKSLLYLHILFPHWILHQTPCRALFVVQVIRNYHGHLSAVYSIDIHPTIDIIATCGRDSTCRVRHSLYVVIVMMG